MFFICVPVMCCIPSLFLRCLQRPKSYELQDSAGVASRPEGCGIQFANGSQAKLRWVFAGFDWRLGFVLGAVVATTDAIAATSIAKRVGLPQGIVDILEGESLLNDATGLLALEFGVAMVVTGETPTLGSGLMRLGYLIVAAIALGLLLGVIVELIQRHNR
jgi:NhaP-type Na+/H+ or K+/H+ antiporter